MQLSGGITVEKGDRCLIVRGEKCYSIQFAKIRFENRMEHYETLNYLTRNNRLWNE